MIRSASEVLRSLETRVARLEGRTAVYGRGPEDISTPPKGASVAVTKFFNEFQHEYMEAVVDLKKRKEEVMNSTSALVLESEERAAFLDLIEEIEGGLRLLDGAKEAAYIVSRLYYLLNRLSVLSKHLPGQETNLPRLL